ncbi:MAG: bifunctional demethylmenaquinone methyltransferase/2-methoxy-6-polyprenyl-1,4-benzoquinol methylase UbiE [Bacteroidales bacterium]|nr:bifunctional demethylmenaquinone methyltransferase/2-methoxy-6-polyprenyl-1,4-benzoquinol methylase UbiE [Bacteroidales bacterium]
MDQYNTPGKKLKVEQMFNDIAPKYDLLNHVLSAGIDIRWRIKVRKLLKPIHPQSILDVATGTGDLAIELSKLQPKKIVGLDIAAQMLEVGKLKIKKAGLDQVIEMVHADSAEIPFSDNHFDAVTVAFGVRNFENLQNGLKEMCRVLKPKGRVVVLEFSKPNQFLFKQMYQFYFKFILPTIGKAVSKNKEAYTYLPDSVQKFAEGRAFLDQMKMAGFVDERQMRLTMGIATIYWASK